MQAPAHAGTELPEIRIRAINTAANSKGSIHDDDKARAMGYEGGFVPGVTVLGYMTRLMNESFGADWLRTGTFHGRLRLPTYANAEVTVGGTVAEAPSAANGGRVTVELQVVDNQGRTTATGTAGCLVTP